MRLNNYWKISTLIFSLFYLSDAKAQNSWVFLKDKACRTSDFFNQPINPHYISQLTSLNVEIIGQSRWLNAVCIANKDAAQISHLNFVSHISSLLNYEVNEKKIDEDYGYGKSDVQLEMLKLHEYHKLGYTGRGVKLALFDAGFYKMNELPIFDSLWSNNQVIANYDFVLNEPVSYTHSAHGMAVSALVALNYPDSMMGASPDVSLVLARTEDAPTEKHTEELNWLRAMEWADSIGVDIIHSSLGYSKFDSLEGDYSYADMDGKTTIITLAAELAANRGIFITNSAGNQGASDWYYITAPCDGKNVLCIGAVDSFRTLADFSSRGPSSDGRTKPDVVAMGKRTTIPNEFGQLVTSNGTSLSGPLVAGMIACLKQAHPNKNNDQLFKAVLMGSDNYDSPNNNYGYGIPDVLKIDSILRAWPSLSVQNTSKIPTTIYPNPSHNMLQINCEPGSSYRITSTTGVELDANTLPNWINFVDISTLISSPYFIEIHSSQKETFKFIKID